MYSQKSSRTAANYRWNILGPARLSVDIGPFLQGQFDPVFKCEIPVNRKALVHRIAKDFDDFTDALDGARRENGLMRPFEKALVAMDHDKKFHFPMFAGTVYYSHISFICQSADLICRLGTKNQTSYCQFKDSATRPRKWQ